MDNEIFTIGDKVFYGKEGIITAFRISESGEMLCDIEFNKISSYSNALLRAIDIIKPKELIYTTFDNIPIYKGDNIPLYVVDEKFCFWNDTLNSDYCFKDNRKYFASKEKRDSFIVHNCPISVSYNELVIQGFSADWVAIRDFFKSKLHL